MPNECNTRAHQSEKRVHGGMSTPTRKLSVPSLLVVVTMCPQPGVGLVLQETWSSCGRALAAICCNGIPSRAAAHDARGPHARDICDPRDSSTVYAL